MSRIDLVVRAARRRYRRLPAAEVPDALRRGAVLVDIRPQAQRFREGGLPGALVIERNVLEWRCDPTSNAKLPEAVGDDVEWVIVCSEGYTSSLAVAALLDIGLHRATDVIGGYHELAGARALDQLGSGGAVMAVQGDRTIGGHLHTAHLGTSFARAYVIPSAHRVAVPAHEQIVFEQFPNEAAPVGRGRLNDTRVGVPASPYSTS